MRKPSPAFVISLIALFVALGGTGYAAFSLPRNSVGTAQLKNGAVTKQKIARKTLSGLRGPQGLPGPKGDTGPKGDPGAPGPAAYALVNPTSGSPQLIAAHTSGFAAVSIGSAGQGDYCLTPAPGVDVVHTAAVADQDATYSNVFGFVTVRYPTGDAGSPINCPAGQLEVKTFDQSGPLTNQISFTVNVP